jgi:predicted aldo/keto reductase-like oxidoreductase
VLEFSLFGWGLSVQRVVLGKSGMSVTMVGFGGIPIQRLDDFDSTKVIRRAVELGIDWFDTARAYGDSEARIGRAIRPFDRSGLKIFSKSYARDADKFRSDVQLTLDRIGLEYIDLYQFHMVADSDDWNKIVTDGVLYAATDLKEKGVIRHIGASAHRHRTMIEVAQHPAIEVVQFPFSFIEPDGGLEVLQVCRERDVGFIAMKPFGGGMLDDASACMRFLMQYEGIAIDPGFEKTSEIEEVINLVEQASPPTDKDLASIERLKSQLGKSFCRRCGYCMPCEQGVDIVALMAIESIVKRVPLDSLIDGRFGKAAREIDKCTGCGRCEKKCPYNLSIRKRIKSNAQLMMRFAKERNSA